jgi:cytochrome c oxidase subunit 2
MASFLRVSWCLPAALAVTTVAPAQDPPQVRQETVHFWNNECGTCHGIDGRGIEEIKAPALAGLPDYHVMEQVENFRRGLRAAAAGSGFDPVAEMHRETLELDDALFRELAMHIASLPANRPAQTLFGHPEAGRQPYQELCAECHGDRAQGDPAKRVPPLHLFNDWYLVEQIRRFRVGLRRPDPTLAESVRMHAMALRFPTLQEARDIALYVNSHLEPLPDAEP